MKYFLDSAILSEIDFAYDTFGIDGVTTNPRHIQNSGKPFLTVVNELAEWVKSKDLIGYEIFPVSVEVNPHFTQAEDMIKMGREIAKMSPNFVIKIPCIEQGIKAARSLESEGIRTNVTLVFSASQALIPAKNGSLFVSPFIGWKETNGEDCKQYITDIVDMYCNFGYETEIICAAIRTGKQIVDCAIAGADIVTAGLQVFLDSFKHPYTREGLEKFQDAWDKTLQK